jgi:hypothetical protein
VRSPSTAKAKRILGLDDKDVLPSAREEEEQTLRHAKSDPNIEELIMDVITKYNMAQENEQTAQEAEAQAAQISQDPVLEVALLRAENRKLSQRLRSQEQLMVREQARYLATKDLVEKQTSIIENMKEKERDLVEKLKEHDASIEAEHAHIATLQETVQNFEVRLRKRNEELKEKTAECEALERINSLWMSQGKSDIQRQLEKMQAKWDKEKEELNRQWQQRVDEKDALLQILQLEVNRLTENMKDDDSE